MKSLEIVVCMKPVPDPKKWDKLKLDPETMLLTRGAVPAVINTLDRNAIEQAVALKAQCGGTIHVVTMAPPDSEDLLREALAMGCDHAYLLTDKAFAGADSLATARCLAASIRKIGNFDLIFCGGYSLDGSTSQVGPQIAELLDIPDLTHVTSFDLREKTFRVQCKLDDGHAVYESDLPALVTFDREANSPRLPSMVGIMAASRKEIKAWTPADLELDPASIGLAGSPTQMLNIFTPPVGRKGEILQGTPNELARELINRLRAEKVIH
jgi:electron transfer flavoprotein beta subunit